MNGTSLSIMVRGATVLGQTDLWDRSARTRIVHPLQDEPFSFGSTGLSGGSRQARAPATIVPCPGVESSTAGSRYRRNPRCDRRLRSCRIDGPWEDRNPPGQSLQDRGPCRSPGIRDKPEENTLLGSSLVASRLSFYLSSLALHCSSEQEDRGPPTGLSRNLD